MQHKRPPVPAIIVVVLALVTGGYYGIRYLNRNSNNALDASGSIEATTVNVSPETSGKVKEVLAEEGQPVRKGDPLFRLDDTLLSAQRASAAAGLEVAKSGALTAQAVYDSAQAQYDITLTSAQAEDRATRIQDWLGKTPDYFDQPKWYFTRSEQIAAAQVEVDAAQADFKAAQENLNKVIGSLNNSKFLDAEKRLSDARVAYLVALQVYGRSQASGGTLSPDELPVGPFPAPAPGYRIRIRIAKEQTGNDDLVNAAQDTYDAAQAELVDAQNAYNDLLTTDEAVKIREARAALLVAQERYNTALDRFNALHTGEESPRVTAAALAVQQAKSAAEQAQDAVAQAQANLNLIEAQMSKLTIYAPMDGVILVRNVEPGEFVQPGAAAMTMADLNNLTITVYVPEDQYGKISLGQKAAVTVDSFPGVAFNAEVIHIADQAEFTPRNVQTVEGRSSTVYAIKLKVTDTEGKLKIGMPADVAFK